jgi:hypothetical protein
MYEAIIREAVVQEPDARGQSVRLKFELCGAEFGDQNTITQWFRIFTEDDEPFEPGIKSLAYNFAKLGLELDFNTIDEVCAELSEERPGVIVKVVHNPSKTDSRVFIDVSVEKPTSTRHVARLSGPRTSSNSNSHYGTGDRDP